MIKQKDKIKILMLAAEMSPLAKAGGLADVVGSLPTALSKLNCEVCIMLPKYGVISEEKYSLKKIRENLIIKSNKKNKSINIYQTQLKDNNINIYLIDIPEYFSDKEKIYYGNGAEKYLLFSLSALCSLEAIGYKPDIIHCHDFHTGLIPDILEYASSSEEKSIELGLNYDYIKDIKTLYTIHNLNYQGKTELETLSTGNLSSDSLHSLRKDAQDGDINFMVQGIINADLVNTVSPTYAKEICNSTYGAGLERVILANQSKMSGILNGIDVDFFNPETDKFIYKNYNFSSISDKVENKIKLQEYLGLPVDENKIMIGFVSRLAWQKGVELFSSELVEKLDAQFVFLGTGEEKYETYLIDLANKFSDKVSAKIMFNVELAQKIYAASDIFVIPSRFEPCGLTQMIAMRYGAVPVARATGGLDDSIDSEVGFKFPIFSSDSLFGALNIAVELYYQDKNKWNLLQKNGMIRDFSWTNSAKKYLDLYNNLLKN